MNKVDRWVKVAIVVGTVFLNSVTAEAATLEVGPSGYPYTSIQAAINDAVSGVDDVLVHDGIYVENINFLGQQITVRSENGADHTIIDGNFNDSVVTFNYGEGSDSVLDGFSLRNGWAPFFIGGGGVLCDFSSPSIINCRISGNISNDLSGGGGIAFYNSTAIIINCTITGNLSFVGGGISLVSSSPTIAN